MQKQLLIDILQKSCSENFGKYLKYYFSKVIGLHSTILLEQDPIRDNFFFNFSRLSKQLVLYGRLLLNLQTFLIFSILYCRTCILKQRVLRKLKLNFSISGCDSHVVGYGFVGRIDSQSFFLRQWIYFFIYSSFTTFIDLLLNI